MSVYAYSCRPAQLLRLGVPVSEMLQQAHARLVDKVRPKYTSCEHAARSSAPNVGRSALTRGMTWQVTRGVVLAKDKRILHTAPHHDDIMLSYHAALGVSGPQGRRRMSQPSCT